MIVEANPFVHCNAPVAGLDLSLRCPALTIIFPTTEPSYIVPWKFCKSYYLTDKKSMAKHSGTITGELFGAWDSDGERYETISEWVCNTLNKHNVKHIGIEGYAYSRNYSSLTMLAENLGLLKYFLYKNSITYDLYTPSSIKKCASGSGNADKNMMVDSFIIDTGFDIMAEFGRTKRDKVVSPIHDIADSYYVACSARIALAVQTRDYQPPPPPPKTARRRRK
jgi:Holliday junction resolvasome RuvABC endonuclease subunit